MTRVAAAALLLLSLSACSYFGREPAPYRPPALAASPLPEGGRELYLRDCSWCHGPAGRGTDRGPDLVSGTNGPALVDFVLSTGRMPIDQPRERMERGEPAYTAAQRRSIVDYTRELGAPGPDIPELAIADADVAHGNELYQENCAACHSTTGIGGVLAQGRGDRELGGDVRISSSFLVPPVLDSSAVEVAEAVRAGPGNMPVFGDETFDGEDLNAIVAYVMYLQDPADRGGADAGRIGPVAEGAVGWILGMGLLLLVARWMGTKRGEE